MLLHRGVWRMMDIAFSSRDWIALVVSNPVTQEWRELPVPDHSNVLSLHRKMKASVYT